MRSGIDSVMRARYLDGKEDRMCETRLQFNSVASGGVLGVSLTWCWRDIFGTLYAARIC